MQFKKYSTSLYFIFGKFSKDEKYVVAYNPTVQLRFSLTVWFGHAKVTLELLSLVVHVHVSCLQHTHHTAVTDIFSLELTRSSVRNQPVFLQDFVNVVLAVYPF